MENIFFNGTRPFVEAMLPCTSVEMENNINLIPCWITALSLAPLSVNN